MIFRLLISKNNGITKSETLPQNSIIVDFDTKIAQTSKAVGAAVPVGAIWDLLAFTCESVPF